MVTGKNCQENPQVAFLALIPGSIKSIKKGIFRFCLMAGIALIPRHWKSQITPIIREWVVEMKTYNADGRADVQQITTSGKSGPRGLSCWSFLRCYLFCNCCDPVY